MESKSMVTLTIDGTEVEAPEGMTVLEAAGNIGIHIPTLCHHPDLSPYGGCRLCLVEVDEAPRLAAGCVTPVRNGMSVVTSNDRIFKARRAVLQWLMSERNHFCMFCAQSGDCELQDLFYEYRIDHLDIPSLDQVFPVDASHEDMAWDHNRCILCGRCVRACREIAGNAVLDFQGRGGKTIIGADLGKGLGQSSCVSCGVCLEFCPTGAIFNRHRTHYAVKGKSRDWIPVESICPECGLLCPTTTHVWQNTVIKIESRSSHGKEPDRGQLCRKGRFDPLKTQGEPLREPLVRMGDQAWQVVGWNEALGRVTDGLSDAARRHGPEAVWGLISPGCSNEEIQGVRAMFETCFPGGCLDTLNGRGDRNLAAAAGYGNEIREASWGDILQSDFILVIGANPARTHPIVNSLIKRAVYEKHAAATVIGSENPLGIWATIHLPVKDVQIPQILGLFLQKAGSVCSPSTVAEKLNGWNGENLEKLIQGYRGARYPLVILGPGVTGFENLEGLGRALALTRIQRTGNGKPAGLIVLKPGGNCAAVREIGLEALEKANALARARAGFLLLSEGDLPDPELRPVLDRLAFLAVVSPIKHGFFTETAKVLLPKPNRMEADGTYTSVDGAREMFKPRVLQPPEGIQPVERLLAALQDGLTGPGDQDVRTPPGPVRTEARSENGG